MDKARPPQCPIGQRSAPVGPRAAKRAVIAKFRRHGVVDLLKAEWQRLERRQK